MANNQSLREFALACLRGGVSIIPIAHESKQPEASLLPEKVDAEGNIVINERTGEIATTWKPYQHARATEQEVNAWFDSGIEAYAFVGGQVSGGLEILDFDEEGFYEAWHAEVGGLDEGLPLQRTGGGTFQIAYRCPRPAKNQKLAWVPDAKKESGRRIAIETRGEHGYAVGPGSLHPSSNRYQALAGDFTNIPSIPQARRDVLIMAACKLDQAPLSRQQLMQLEKARTRAEERKAQVNGQGSVIDLFNEKYTIESELERNGYIQCGTRYIRPNAESDSVPGVFIQNGRSFHHSTNDLLHDGYWHTAFDVFCQYEHNGDVKEAVKEAARRLGLPPLKQQESAADSKPSDGNEETTAQALIRIGRTATFYRTPDGDLYARFKIGEHQETWSIREHGSGFRRWLVHQYYLEHGKAPNASALTSAMELLTAIAQFEGERKDVYTRVGWHEGALYIDLGDETWDAIKVASDGWEIVKHAPVLFRRPRGMLPLPRPDRDNASLDLLRELLGFENDSNWRLVCAWLLATLHPNGPYPHLAFYGERGTGKSTRTRALRNTVDPNEAAVRSAPKDERDFAIAAKNSRIVAYDNLSHLSNWLSDSLCRLSTGAGGTYRKLYTDDDEALFADKRPAIFNGIEEVATRGDLLDRTITITLPFIPPEKRQTEQEFQQQFDALHPRILAGLLNAVSTALRNLPHTKLDRLPRMADFAQWVEAAAPALGWNPGDFIKDFDHNQETAIETELEASPLAQAVIALRNQEDVDFQVPAGVLLRMLGNLLGDDLPKKGWPASARALSGQLRRVAPALRAVGIYLTWGSSNGSRYIRVARMDSDANRSDSDANRSRSDANSDAKSATVTAKNTALPLSEAAAPSNSDGSDGRIPTFSVRQQNEEEEQQAKGERLEKVGIEPSLPSLASLATDTERAKALRAKLSQGDTKAARQLLQTIEDPEFRTELSYEIADVEWKKVTS